MFPFFKIAGIRNKQINAEHFTGWKTHPTVDHNNRISRLEGHHVFANPNIAETAEKDDSHTGKTDPDIHRWFPRYLEIARCVPTVRQGCPFGWLLVMDPVREWPVRTH